MTSNRIGLAAAALAAGLLFLCIHSGSTPTPTPENAFYAFAAEHQIADEPIQPVPQKINFDPRRVALGRRLFFETRLSHDNSLSCASCHDLAKGGADQKPLSHGIYQAVVAVNSPTVYNSALNYKQFWNVRAPSLEEQVDGPVQGEKEMGSTWPEVLDKLKQDAEYPAAFRAVYPDGIQRENVKNAIAAFEKTLITPNCRLDRYLRGEKMALSSDEKQGYALFKSYGCSSCHQGVNIGGNMIAKFGVMADYFAARGQITEADNGRYNITKREADRHCFKVPSLRNITRTAPYFHDGSTPTLGGAVALMARYQLGRTIAPKETEQIVKFLSALEGETEGVKP
jgi:cytochrome c peroxidase